MNEIELFQEVVEPKVKSFFNAYKNYYLSCAIDFEDLKQEMFIEYWQIYKNKKIGEMENDDDKKKLIHKCMRNQLINNTRNFNRNFLTIEMDFEDLIESTLIDSVIEVEQIHEQLEIDLGRIFFWLLENVLDEREYNIIFMRFIEKRTFEQIGEELGISLQRVHLIYNQILSKLRKKIKKC